MTRTWLTIQVELISGRGEYYWPRPGRIFVARRSFTFRQLANAINLAFGRWELAHLHRFVLGDGTEIVPVAWWDEVGDDAADDATTALSRLQLGEQFAYEFDLGDGWAPVACAEPAGDRASGPMRTLGRARTPDQRPRAGPSRHQEAQSRR